MRWPEKQFVLSERHRFLYLPIEKVACSTIKYWAIDLEEGPGASRHVDPHSHSRERYDLQARPWSVRRRALRDPTLLRFAFVRNPWDRLVSGFLNKFVSWKSPAQRFANQFDHRMKWRRVCHRIFLGVLCRGERASSATWREDLTFRQFVAEVRQRNPRRLDLHWRPQYLSLGGQRLDFLGRFENLVSDFRSLCQKLQVPGELYEANKTARDLAVCRNLADAPLAELRSLTGFPRYQWFYTPDLIEKVADLYAEDIRRFEYAFEEPATTSNISRAA